MENRRSVMTKRMIKDALTELLNKEDMHSISVRMLCSKADINRSTFYLHYETIEDLINEYTNDFMTRIWQSDHVPMNLKDYEQIITEIIQHPVPYRALLKSGLYHQYILNQYNSIDFENDPSYRKYDKNAFMMVSSYTTAGIEQMLLYILDHHHESLNTSDIAAAVYRLNASAVNQIKQLTGHA